MKNLIRISFIKYTKDIVLQLTNFSNQILKWFTKHMQHSDNTPSAVPLHPKCTNISVFYLHNETLIAQKTVRGIQNSI